MLKKIKKIHYILILILLLGAFLRFHNLGEFSFSADEFLDINSTYGFHKTGQWQAWDFNLQEVEKTNTFAPRDERAWLYKWQTAQLFNFFAPTESVARTMSALWGVLSILLIYFIATNFTKQKTIGLLSAFFLAVSLDAIEFSRTFRMYAMFFPVFLTFSWAMFNALEKEYKGKIKIIKTIWDKLRLNALYLILAIVLGLLSLHLHLLSVNILFVLALYFLTMTFLSKNKYLNKYSIYLGIGITALMLGFFTLGDKLKTATQEIGWGINHFSYLEKVFSDYASPLLTLGFVLLGSFYLFKVGKLKKESLWLTTSFWGVLMLAVFFWDRNVGNQYIFFIKSFQIILLSSGVYFVANYLKENLKSKGQKFFLTTLFLSLILVPNWGFFLKKENFYNQTSKSETPQYRKIFAYFKKQRKDSDILVTRNFRNYYFSNEKIEVQNLGGERSQEKLTLEKLQQIIQENPSGWIILSENDEIFVSKEAELFINKNLQKVSNSQVRGPINVYRWKK